MKSQQLTWTFLKLSRQQNILQEFQFSQTVLIVQGRSVQIYKSQLQNKTRPEVEIKSAKFMLTVELGGEGVLVVTRGQTDLSV